MNIHALYEIKRQAFLIGYIQSPERFSDSLAFAYEHRLTPIFHEDIMRETHGADPFAEAYNVPADFMNKVLKYVDECDLAKTLDKIAFSKLENKFGGYKVNRLEIVRTLEYARIDGRFGDEVFAAIEDNAPVEANNIANSFSADKVYFS